MHLNLVDILIIATLLLAAFDGMRRGVVNLMLDLLAFVLAVVGAALVYQPLGAWLGSFGVSAGLQPMLGFFAALVIIESLLRIVTGFLGSVAGRIVRLGIVGSLLGAGLALIKQSVLLAILINLLLFLPVMPRVRTEVQSSRLGPVFAVQTPVLERAFSTLVTPAVQELQQVSTVVKITDDPVEIDTPVTQLVVDPKAEQELFRLVNEERRERGLGELKWSKELSEVGRVHSKDMWTRQYFAHINPDGKTPFDRIDAAGIEYQAAGENLALAPTTPIAHEGLMNSPGHRENILNPDYGQLGIGAVRNGLYGVMYTQLFTD